MDLKTPWIVSNAHFNSFITGEFTRRVRKENETVSFWATFHTIFATEAQNNRDWKVGRATGANRLSRTDEEKSSCLSRFCYRKTWRGRHARFPESCHRPFVAANKVSIKMRPNQCPSPSEAFVNVWDWTCCFTGHRPALR